MASTNFTSGTVVASSWHHKKNSRLAGLQPPGLQEEPESLKRGKEDPCLIE